MPRYRLDIEYDGTPFHGWQKQADGPTVQGALQDALVAYCGVNTVVHGAGRTDSGVHAFGQVAHIDLPETRAPDQIRDALNFHLRPLPVVVLRARPVPASFDARFSAVRRAYRYLIENRRAPTAIHTNRRWQVPRPLDVDAMAHAASHFLGHHDFTTFRAAGCQAKSPMRTVDHCTVTREGDLITIDVRARSFLHAQVRSMAGSLKMVGEGRWAADEIAVALAARDRKRCGPVAPACGLYFMQVDYPDAV
ncbi:MAG: tRNA pseudouridine(38-40) synthase TruA [Pseudomonadota bacterium]